MLAVLSSDIPPQDREEIINSAVPRVRALFEELVNDENTPRNLFSIIDSIEWLHASGEKDIANQLAKEFTPVLIEYIEVLIERSVASENKDANSREAIWQGIHWLSIHGKKDVSETLNKHYATLLARKMNPPKSVIKKG